MDDLLEFEAGGRRIASQYWGPADELVADGFWGHLGILLPGHTDHQWYPITGGEEERIQSVLQGSGEPSNWLVVATLNNRVLLINPLAVQRIRLLDDAVDAPSDDNWNLTWDGYQGLSPEVYRAIGEHFWDPEVFESEFSEALQKMALDQIDEHEIDEEKAFSLLECTYIYLAEGTKVALRAEDDQLF